MIENSVDCWIALHCAAEQGDVKEVKRLLSMISVVDVNVKVASGLYKGWTALHFATRGGCLENVRLLVENGAVIDTQQENGWTPLHCASFFGLVSIVEFLAFKGACINKQDNVGNTPMHCAAEMGQVEIIEILYAFGADLEIIEPEFGHTALMSAVKNNRVKCVRLLFELNVDTTTSDKFGRNISQTANKEIRKLLLEYSRKPVVEREQTRLETLDRIRFRLGLSLMRYVQQDIIGICLAMYPLELPSYVLLWIIDCLPRYYLLSHHKKIQLIENVRNSIWKIEKKTTIEITKNENLI